MLCTEIDFDIQINFCKQHVLPMFCKKKSFWQGFTCTEPEWRAMTSVKDINFSNNNISISYIPESFRTTYTQLLNLNLSQNSIGPSLDIFPDLNFRASEKLFLDLSRNRIKYLSYASAIENLKPNHASEGHDVQIDIIGNGNTGCRLFKKGIQH